MMSVISFVAGDEVCEQEEGINRLMDFIKIRYSNRMKFITKVLISKECDHRVLSSLRSSVTSESILNILQ